MLRIAHWDAHRRELLLLVQHHLSLLEFFEELLLRRGLIEAQSFHGFSLDFRIARQRIVVLSCGLAQCSPFLRRFVQRFVILKHLVAANAAEIRLKCAAAALGALVRPHCLVLFMCVLTFATSLSSRNIPS